MIRKSIALLVTTSLLSGCLAFRGPEPVMERGNVLHQDRQGQRGGYLYDRFRRATLDAAGCGTEELAEQAPQGPRPPIRCRAEVPAAVDSAQRAKLEAFMRAGYELVYAECADFFEAMGRRQRGTRALRATLSPISDLITGIVALARFDDSQTRDDLLTGFSLFSQATTNALNIYDQQFLFGADNVDAVRGLVQDALRVHARSTFGADVEHDTFGRAANHIGDNQAICGPSRILTLVRSAIAAGKIEARVIESTTRTEETDVETATTATATTGAETQENRPPATAPRPQRPARVQRVLSDRVEVRVAR